MSLLSGSVQPPLLFLLSSTSQPALSPLFDLHTDATLPKDSFIILISDTSVASASTSTLKEDQEIKPKHPERGSLIHPVIHIQSPNIRSTYIQAGISVTEYRNRREKGKAVDRSPLGIEIPWIGLHVRRLGKREMAFEVGVVDAKGREGIIRCSTFKETPSLHPHRSPPVLHLPINTPPQTASTLTPWLHISINLAQILPLFLSLPRNNATDKGDEEDGEDTRPNKKRRIVELPNGQFGSVSYVRIYANCRIRRIWFAEDGEKTLEGLNRAGKEEWGLYAGEY